MELVESFPKRLKMRVFGPLRAGLLKISCDFRGKIKEISKVSTSSWS
jgi:hypothetical protein